MTPPRIRVHSRSFAAKYSQCGVTLMELMIAITLVAALSTGMLMAMRISLNTLEKTQVRLEENRRAMGVQQLVLRQLGGVIPVLGECGTPRSPVFVGGYN